MHTCVSALHRHRFLLVIMNINWWSRLKFEVIKRRCAIKTTETAAAESQNAESQPQASTSQAPASSAASLEGQHKEPVPLVDYIHNVMKFVDAILSNNSTDDHCREFVSQKGKTTDCLQLKDLPCIFLYNFVVQVKRS